MFDRLLLETSTVDGLLLEDGSGVLLLEGAGSPVRSGQLEGAERSRQYMGLAAKAERADLALNLLASTLAAATNTTLRPPLHSARPASRTPMTFETPNLLLTTLGAPAATPFKGYDGSVQVRSAQRARLDPEGRNLPVALVGAPFSNPDFVAAIRRLAARSDLAEVPNLPLASVGTPFSNSDAAAVVTRWAPPRSESVWYSNLLLASVGAPFARGDVYEARRYRSQRLEEPNNLALTTLSVAQTALPFNTFDWAAAMRRASLRGDLEVRNLPLAVVGAPFAPRELSELRTPSRRSRVDDHVNLAVTTLAAVVATPFRSVDWPLPPRRLGTRVELDPRNLALSAAAVAAPFSNFDWLVRVRAPAMLGAEVSRPAWALLQQAVARPFTVFDWEARRIPAQRRADDPTFLHLPIQHLIGALARTYFVNAEHRQLAVNAEHRSLAVNVEQRAYAINAEHRSLAVNMEHRQVLINPEHR